jgi:hypothetical protein
MLKIPSMKKINVLLATVLVISAAITASAQTTAPTPSTSTTNAIVGLLGQFDTWLTTPDTNNTTLETTRYRVETGPALQNGATVSDDFFVQVNLTNGLSIVSETRNAAIAGTIVCQELGLGYNVYQKWDTEVTAYGIGGYRFDTSDPVGSIGVVVRHMLNKTMYVAPSVQYDFGGGKGNTSPLVMASVGFAF